MLHRACAPLLAAALVTLCSYGGALAQAAGEAVPQSIVRAPQARFQPAPDSAAAPRRLAGQAIEYSEWYGRRLTVHRVASYAMLLLFAAQYYTGTRLMDKGSDAPSWARTIHGPLAASVAGLFTVNTVTGAWNLWEGRKDAEGRFSRTAHAVLMMAADAGFAATGFLACESEDPGCNRSRHRAVALGSMGVAATSFVIMLPPLRR